MPGDIHNVWRCPHPDCRAVQQRERAGDPLADRRQRAREAWLDDFDEPGEVVERHARALNVAIETASRVRIDDAIVRAFDDACAALNREQVHGRPPKSEGVKCRAGLIAAFRAAGFEVEA